MRSAVGAIVGLLGLPGIAAQAQPAQPSETQLAAASGKPYDVVANCLMRQMSSRQFTVWPLVYAPPRQEAYVNLWRRGQETDPPVAVFHIVQEPGGLTRISYRQTPGVPGPPRNAAEAAARTCLR